MSLRLWKHSTERPRSHEHSMKHLHVTIMINRRCTWTLWRIDTELASLVSQCEQYRKSPLPATFGFCRRIYCWAKTGVQRWWKRRIAHKVFPNNFQNVFQANVKKIEATMLLATDMQQFHKSLIIAKHHVAS